MQLQRPKPNQYKFEELMMKKLFALTFVTLFATVATAKIPAVVLTDEAKAKAAETAAKTAWSGKVDGFLLCKSQDKAAVHYYKTATSTKPAAVTPPCADPGPFVYPLPVVAAPAAGATPAVVAPAVAAAVAPAKKP